MLLGYCTAISSGVLPPPWGATMDWYTAPPLSLPQSTALSAHPVLRHCSFCAASLRYSTHPTPHPRAPIMASMGGSQATSALFPSMKILQGQGVKPRFLLPWEREMVTYQKETPTQKHILLILEKLPQPRRLEMNSYALWDAQVSHIYLENLFWS